VKTERGSVSGDRVTRSPLDVDVLIKVLIVIKRFVYLCTSVIDVYDNYNMVLYNNISIQCVSI